MPEEQIKSFLFSNILLLLKEQGKKIGEFENEAGVSAGYISRSSKDGTTKPGIDFIMKAAEVLNVSIDTLLRVDLVSATPTERYLIAFLEKLIDETTFTCLNWEKESAYYLNDLEPDVCGNSPHSLFDFEYDPNTGSVRNYDLHFYSRSFNGHTKIAGDCYNMAMINGAVLYIMDICDANDETGNNEVKELWMDIPHGPREFLCSTKDNIKLSPYLESLYAAIAHNAKLPKVSKDVREVIDAYMDEIPF